MNRAYLLGIHSTAVGRFGERGFKDLVRETVTEAIRDAGLDHQPEIQSASFGNALMDRWGQSGGRGHVCLGPLMEDETIPAGIPIVNVEGGCATASVAFQSAWKDVVSGQTEVSLAVGVEKLWSPSDPKAGVGWMERLLDQLDPDHWKELWRRWGRSLSVELDLAPDHSVAMDYYGLAALEHMQRHGTTREQIALAATLCHNYGAKNPRAQYRFETTVEDVLADRIVFHPLTRAMCAPIGDGASAALVCSEAYLKRVPPRTRERAIRIRACALAGGRYEFAPGEPKAPKTAAERAYQLAGIGPRDVDVLELHDATSFAMIHLLEDLGYCGEGEGGPFIESGATKLGGEIPTNLSGGLVSRGHPIGATGLMMINELAIQLRGEAGEVQVEGAQIALQENGGGLIGREIALTSAIVLERER